MPRKLLGIRCFMPKTALTDNTDLSFNLYAGNSAESILPAVEEIITYPYLP